ncbi:hypothetical protein HK097_000078 [Rhizophlyctis rosea]|uniref:DUF1308 domain-containing protein n=1 Tax=Rhizophlyctis rosea TaxID=64517 RepID=A0AAD5SRP3_9FUNG|nr:hypothetical protein HK097_000078 [Rhizophlyctis rosea]
MSETSDTHTDELDPAALLERATILRNNSSTLLARIDALISAPSLGSDDIPIGKPLKKKKKKSIEPVNGLTRFRNLVLSEDRFLAKLLTTPSSIKPAHVRGTNIPYLTTVFNLLLKERNVTHVYKNFRLPQYRQPVRVDIISDDGRRWVKVKASAMTGLATELIDEEESEAESDYDDDSDDEEGEEAAAENGNSVAGNSDFDTPREGQESVDSSLLVLPLIKQAKALLVAAKENPIHYQVPTVVMKFLGEIDEKLTRMLHQIGVEVETFTDDETSATTDTPPLLHFSTSSHQSASSPTQPLSKTLNLDTSTLVVLSSDFTHHFDSIPDIAFDYETSRMPYTPKHPKPPVDKTQPVVRALDNDALRLQAEQEKQKPLLPLLLGIFEGRKLVATESAVRKLFGVGKVVAGVRELRRCKGLFAEGELERTGIAGDVVIEGEVEKVPGIEIFIIEDNPSDRFRAVFGTSGEEVLSNGKQKAGKRGKGRPKRFSEHLVAIFGTGDRERATTVSATAWVEQALSDCGIKGLSVWVHESRSFIEQRVGRVRGLVGGDGAAGKREEEGV